MLPNIIQFKRNVSVCVVSDPFAPVVMVGEPRTRGASDERFARQLDESYGLRNLKLEWVSAQRTSRQSAVVRSICNSEIREISDGSLPWSIQDAHRVRLGAKVLVQIDEIINIGAPDPGSSSPRLLQFAFTDGATSFIGIELDTTKSGFSPNTVPGTKVTLLPTAFFRRGRILLTYEDYALVGAPQGRERVPGNGQATQVPPGSIGIGQSVGRSLGGASGVPSMNPDPYKIINVGGIAAVAEESVDGGEVDGLWSENLSVHGRYPAPMGQRIPGSSPAPSSAAEEPIASARRNLSKGELSPRSNDAEASRASPRNTTRRRGSVLAGVRGSSITENRATPVLEQPFTGSTASAVPMDVDVDSTAAQPNQEASEIPSSTRAVEMSNPMQPEPTHESQRMGAVDSPIDINRTSTHIVRLKDLTDSRLHVTLRQQICRLYAMKMGKKADHHLMKGSVVSTIVDDGTAVKIVSLSDELLHNLRISCSSGTETLSRGTDLSIRRFLRSMYGFVNIELRDNTIVATACVPEPVTSTMLSGYLENVNARFATYLAS